MLYSKKFKSFFNVITQLLLPIVEPRRKPRKTLDGVDRGKGRLISVRTLVVNKLYGHPKTTLQPLELELFGRFYDISYPSLWFYVN